MTTHTPWTVESCKDTLPGSIEGSRVFANNAPEGAKLIAQCYGPEAPKHAHLIAAAPETAAERDKLKAVNAELLTALKMARDCIAYCRRAHPDVQAGEGVPVELLIDAAIAKAEST